jgi:hypothetical protein
MNKEGWDKIKNQLSPLELLGIAGRFPEFQKEAVQLAQSTFERTWTIVNSIVAEKKKRKKK